MDTPPPIPPISPSAPELSAPEPIHWLLVLRDVAIVFGLTFLGGFVVGFTVSVLRRSGSNYLYAIVVSNLLLGTLGFVISGCLAPPNRWRHLLLVAFGVWLTGLINVVIAHVSIGQWVGSLLAVALMAGVGGAISYVFKK